MHTKNPNKGNENNILKKDSTNNDEVFSFFENERKKQKNYNLMFSELAAREQQLQTQLANQQAIISQQEVLLNENRSKLKKEHIIREKEFQKELEDREVLFEQRRESMLQRQKKMDERFHLRLMETEDLKKRLENEIFERENAINEAQKKLEEEKKKYSEESRRQI